MQIMLHTRVGAVAQSSTNKPTHVPKPSSPPRDVLQTVDRRGMLMGAGIAALSLTLTPKNALAVQGITAGRIPGLSTEVWDGLVCIWFW